MCDENIGVKNTKENTNIILKPIKHAGPNLKMWKLTLSINKAHDDDDG